MPVAIAALRDSTPFFMGMESAVGRSKHFGIPGPSSPGTRQKLEGNWYPAMSSPLGESVISGAPDAASCFNGGPSSMGTLKILLPATRTDLGWKGCAASFRRTTLDTPNPAAALITDPTLAGS